MLDRRVLALPAVLLSALSLSGAAARDADAFPEASNPPAPVTMLTVPGTVVGFAQDGDHLVWGNGDAPCGRIVQLRRLSTGASRFLDARRGPMCRETEHGGMQHDMALLGTRAVWAYVLQSFSQARFTLFTAAPKDRAEGYVLSYRIDHDDPFAGPAQLAASASGLFVANGWGFVGEDGGSPAGLYRVHDGRVTRLEDTEYVFDVSASRSRIALARSIPGGRLLNSSPAWSPDGTRIAFVSERAEGGASQLFVMNGDGSGLRLLMDDVVRYEWSPDGTALGVAQGKAARVLIASVDGRVRRVVHRGASQFAWSPDGRLLAYEERVLGRESRVLVASASGAPAVDLGPGEAPFSWSPDSGLLAWSRAGASDYHVYVAPVSGGTAIDLGVGYGASWSPDGSAVTFTGRGSVVVAASDGSGLARPIVPAPRTPQDIATIDPTWSPDGRWIAFARVPLTGFAPPEEVGLWIVPPEGGAPRRLATVAHSPVWAPNSRKIAFDAGEGAGRSLVAVVDIDGGALRNLHRGPWRGVDWSPDGSRLVYSTNEIAVVAADGGEPSLLTRTVPAPVRVAVEIRTPAGRLRSSFDASRQTRGLAFAGSRVALVVGRSGRRATIEIRKSSGKLLRRVDVPRPAWNQISMSGRWVVFWTWPVAGEGDRRTIWLLDAETGGTAILARARVVVGLSVDGRRVAWAEQAGKRSRIRAVVLPRGGE